MTLSPLAFPVLPAGIARVSLDIERVDFAAPEARGRGGGVQAGWPLWLGRWELDRVDPQSAEMWGAFIDRLRGRQRLFIGGDVARPFPAAYPLGFAGVDRASGGAFPGWATGWSQTFDADGNALLALTGLPANMALGRRDYIGFRWGEASVPVVNLGRRALVRVVEPVIASGAGAVTVMVEPPIDTRIVPGGAVPYFDRPAALFRQITEQSSVGSTGSGLAQSPSTLVAAQELWP